MTGSVAAGGAQAWFPGWALMIGLAVAVLDGNLVRMRRNPAARAPVLWWIGQPGITVVLGETFTHGGSGAEFFAE
ncbi:hypothetical protein [Saccharopolyspora gloriosae]|uniref:hypothetical protein n=1 Tax=Saccharopolyspora gloriosae TaxID=455344 RepID=UPI001FB64E90|nr:hypothetical protein [Saccharopolyspora gloriosae]